MNANSKSAYGIIGDPLRKKSDKVSEVHNDVVSILRNNAKDCPCCERVMPASNAFCSNCGSPLHESHRSFIRKIWHIAFTALAVNILVIAASTMFLYGHMARMLEQIVLRMLIPLS